MNKTLREMLHKQPFEPFQVRMSSGDVYEVRHPEFAFLLKSKLVIGYPDSDREVICALLHIVSVQTLQAA